MPNRIVCICAALLAFVGAVPAVALAQGSPGDEQYQDPFGEEQGGGDEGNGGNGGQPEEQPAPAAPAPAPAVPANDVAGEESGSEPETQSDSRTLPRTGADASLIALAGAALLIGGAGLRLSLRRPGA